MIIIGSELVNFENIIIRGNTAIKEVIKGGIR